MARPSHLQGSLLIGSQFLAVFKDPFKAEFNSLHPLAVERLVR